MSKTVSTGFRTRLCISLVIIQLLVVFGSWVWSAAMSESSVRSLLSEGGIRWFFGTFVANLSSPLLVWIILLDIAYGMSIGSGLLPSFAALFSRGVPIDAQRKSGLRAASCLLAVEVAVVMLLTLPPHAVLLSATGSLFPSSFSVSILPIIAFMGVSLSICFGLFSGTLHNYREVVNCACGGSFQLKSILVVYVLAAELYYSVVYVLS